MTGVTLPASMSSFSTTKSSRRSFETNGRSRWRANSDRMGAQRIRRSKPPSQRPPPSPPTITSVPPGGEGAPQLGQRTAARGVNDEVPVARPVREVLAGVIDHLVGADRADRSTLVVLHTPVTSAPNALAS